jgi:site-specific DNA-methyltransferase (adenine-specific)
MGAERAHAMWTDPPYGVAYVGKNKAALTIANDDLKGDALPLRPSAPKSTIATFPTGPARASSPAANLADRITDSSR